MTYPSWLPSWPSNWPDLVAPYVEAIPQAWKRTFKREGLVFADLQAIGEALSAPRRLLEFALRTFLPPADVFGMWLHHWESDFGIHPEGTIADRQARLAMRARLMNKTSAIAIIRSVFAEVFSTTPDDIAVAHVDQSILQAVNTLGDVTGARCNFSYHVHATNEDKEPNLKLGRIAVAELEPAVGRITFGRYKQCTYRRSTYRRACYSRSI